MFDDILVAWICVVGGVALSIISVIIIKTEVDSD